MRNHVTTVRLGLASVFAVVVPGLLLAGAAQPAYSEDATLSADPAEVEFGEQYVGASRRLEIAVRNTGHSDVRVDSATEQGDDRDHFSVSDWCGGVVLQPDDQCFVDVVYGPQAEGDDDASVSVAYSKTSDGQPRPPLEIPVSGMAVPPRPPRVGVTQLVSVDDEGSQGTRPSQDPSISADGQRVAFVSEKKLSADDDNARDNDLYVRDRATGDTILLTPRDDQCFDQGEAYECVGGAISEPVMAANGLAVAFTSAADDLLVFYGPEETADRRGQRRPGHDSGLLVDRVYVYDFVTGRLTQASVDAGGATVKCRNEELEYFGAAQPTISGDGALVAFVTPCAPSVDGEGTDANGVEDVYVRRRLFAPGSTPEHNLQLASRRVACADETCPPGGPAQRPSLSADGSAVAFDSRAADFHDLRSGETRQPFDDANAWSDVFVRELAGSPTYLESVASDGTQGNGDSISPSLSRDAGVVAFSSDARSLAADRDGGVQVFARLRREGETRRASQSDGGVPGNGGSVQPAVSLDGRYVAFASVADNLVAGDTNGKCLAGGFGPCQSFGADVFSHDLVTRRTYRASVDSNGNQAQNESHIGADSRNPSTNEDGRYVAFDSDAENFAPDDNGAVRDVFVHFSILRAAPAALDFGAQAVGTARASRTVTVSNLGTGPVFLLDPPAVFSGPAAGDFRLTGSTCPPGGGRLYPDQECSLSVEFSPTTVGTRSATLTIAEQPTEPYGTPPNPPVVAMSGTGRSVEGASPPSAPRAVTASAGDGEATVSWQPPDSDGGSPVTGYTVTAQPGDAEIQVDPRTVEATVTGLTNRTAYTFTVRAHNRVGAGPPSDPSEPVTPRARRACEGETVPDPGFVDTTGNIHEPAIRCVVWHGVAHGLSEREFAPDRAVTRAQMASFVARVIWTAGAGLPQGRAQFTDVAGNAHAENIERLAAAGVVHGVGDGRYRPDDKVSRAQMASFLARAFAYVDDRPLPVVATKFTDIAGDAHEDNIRRIAGARFTLGTTETTYAPTNVVLRDQMASFLARLLERFANDGRVSPPE